MNQLLTTILSGAILLTAGSSATPAAEPDAGLPLKKEYQVAVGKQANDLGKECNRGGAPTDGCSPEPGFLVKNDRNAGLLSTGSINQVEIMREIRT